MNPAWAFFAVAGLFAAAFGAALVAALRPVLAIAIPCAAAATFLAGVTFRVLRWSSAPVPFRIPLTAGQQASLAGLHASTIDNPSTARGAALRVALEVLLFRSLLRNAALERHAGGRLVFRDALGLWLAALGFHYALLVVATRHLRFVLQPVPEFLARLAAIDGFFALGVPAVYASDVVLVVALTWLVARRLTSVRLRYLSMFSDYALPALILAVALSGLVMRHVARVDVIAVKELALGLVTLSPPSAAALPPLAVAHVVLASVLVALIPFSKLMHFAGVFLSPTRNLANNSRARRHLNPWNAPLPVHTYAEWEDEFRDKMIAAGVATDAASHGTGTTGGAAHA